MPTVVFVSFADAVLNHSQRVWKESIIPALTDYIRIPNVSAAFDDDWEAHGHMAAAVALVHDWCAARSVAGMTIDVHEIAGRTPLILIEIPAFGDGSNDDTVLLYGHIDKQPEMSGWRAGLSPWTPVIENGRLYGRGGADDGYAAFASLTAIEAVQAAGGSHARCVVVIEASEESGSPDLPAHLEALADRIGTPSLVLCLDSGALDYERLCGMREQAQDQTRKDLESSIVQFHEQPPAHAALPPRLRIKVTEQAQRWKTRRTLSAELLSFRDSAAEVRAAPPLGACRT